jgi:glucosamine-6-phosphate deaminase
MMHNHRHTFRKGKLEVRICKSEEEAGNRAADFVEQELNAAIMERGSANLILATGTSQFSFIKDLKDKNLDWGKIRVFHLDEYPGISESHPASFRHYLRERILDSVQPAEVHLINGDAENLEEEIGMYEGLLINHPTDVACIGIGENGHIAFNDPAVADFTDPRLVKIVSLDEACRMQQLGEGWFPSLEDVPKVAITLTIPAIMKSRTISCVVPHKRKSRAVHGTLNGPISTSCPASILRDHPRVMLFLDPDSASEI